MCGYCWPPLPSGIMTTNQSDRPNILFIMADSAVAGLMGAYGRPVVETPTIDKLVESLWAPGHPPSNSLPCGVRGPAANVANVLTTNDGLCPRPFKTLLRTC